MSKFTSASTKPTLKRITFLLILVVATTYTFIKIMSNDSHLDVVVEDVIEPTPDTQIAHLSEEKSENSTVKKETIIAETAANQPKEMIVMQRPVWKLERNLSLHFEALKKAADKGDNEAAHILAMNLRHCYFGAATEVEFEQALSDAYENNDSSNRIRHLTERFDYCQGIDKEQRSQFYKYFEIAANQGFVPTQEIIANITPKLFMESQGYTKLEREAFLKKRDQFIQQKLSYLASASQQGSLRAISRLSDMYYSQNYGSGGLLKAFVLNQAVLELTDDDNSYSRYSRYQQNLQNKLTPEDIDKGLAMSRELLEKIKQKGTLYSF